MNPPDANPSDAFAVVTMNGVRRGARAISPVLVGQLPYATVVGLTAQAHGFSMLEAALMSGLMFAGAAQLLVLGSWVYPPAIFGNTLASTMVNLRFVLMGPLLAPWMDHLRGWRRWGILFFLVDNAWAMSVQDIERGKRDAGFLLGAGLVLWFFWVAGTLAGFLVGDFVAPPPGHPVFFAAIAVFIAMLAPMWKGKRDILPWIAAAGTAALVSHLMPGTAWHVVAGAIVGSALGLLQSRIGPRNAG